MWNASPSWLTPIFNAAEVIQMEMLSQAKQDAATDGAFLVFDNYPFKLAVIQQLMYESELLGDKYCGGDQYFETYGDVSNVAERVSLKRLTPYIEQGNHFFESLNIPCTLADKVTKLYVGEELGIEVGLFA